MLDKIITYSFYALFFLTPLFWTSLNYELFEFNKMILTYTLTVAIVGAWLLKMVRQKTWIINRTPLDLPLLLFLGANVLSTIFSIDPHTSLFGYYSRSNGGLLSIISYLLLYWAFVSNITKDQVLNVLKIGLLSGFLISLWAIFEHFGVSLSCIILRGDFNANCWVQDVQARVFASLGQPNWLAAYLAMLIFPAFYFLLAAKTQKLLVTCYLLLVTCYLAFTFTYSRGPTLGLIGGMAVFLVFYFLQNTLKTQNARMSVDQIIRHSGIPISLIFRVLLSFLVINLLFGSALTSFRLVSQFAAPIRPGISLPAKSNGTQLENGGTESGQIRFIVWAGALDIFKHYPFLGSGVETFAYSYYQFRPISHNLTSEWDFLYNKAHNEYLNYLATTGALGFSTYSIFIITFIIVILRKLRNNLLVASLLASYISYLIYNFFLFSVVIIAIFFYLFPALAFVLTDSLKPLKLKWFLPANKFTKAIIFLSSLYFLYSIFKLWYADVIFNAGTKASDLGDAGKAYNLLAGASIINKGEPFYRSEFAYAAAAVSVALKYDASVSASFKDEALSQTNIVLKTSPSNISFWRTAIRTYFELSTLDDKYLTQTLMALDMAIKLAPTDPKLYYNKALILSSTGKTKEVITLLQKAVFLKPNYVEAVEALKEATSSSK